MRLMRYDRLPERTANLVVSAIGIRRAVGISGIALPVALGLGGLIVGVPIQDNISSYYHTELRDLFVGTMCAIGVFLLCYRGHDWIENWTANIGCVAALGVALCPLDAGSDPLVQKSLTGYVHTFSGGVFFLTLAFYSLVHFPRTSRQDGDDAAHPWERNAIYRTSGLVVLLCTLAMGAYLFLLRPSWKERLNHWNTLFWLESLATWAFASAWLTKGRVLVAELAVEVLAIPREFLSPKRKEPQSPNGDRPRTRRDTR